MSKISIIILVLAIVVIFLLAFIICVDKEIKYLTSQIEENIGEYHNLRVKLPYKNINTLAENINLLYEENQSINVKMKNSEEELKKSIANMSHDLRTPLTSIMGYVQLIKDSKVSNLEKKTYLEIVEKRTSTLKELINNFYDLSLIEGHEYKLNLENLNLKTILEENIALFYDEFLKFNIEPEINIDSDIPKIILDKTIANRIFSNLIKNTLEHGEKYVKITLKKHDDCIISEFRSYAPNLSDKDAEKIFQRFFTANTSRSNEGTGLGLSIVKSFVVNLGHEISSTIENQNLTIRIKWKINYKI